MNQVYTDQLNRRIELQAQPKRIISLVPSLTELLYHFGLDNETVGITKFCIEPEHWFRSKSRIGGTKQVHHNRIAALNPELIIANKEENWKEDIEALMMHYPVWMTDIHTVYDAIAMIRGLGEVLGVSSQATETADQIVQQLNHWKLERPILPVSVGYLIWKSPLMVAGQNTFIHDMLVQGGFRNAFAAYDRYPQISIEELTSVKPDCLFLSSEPYPFREKHRTYWQEQLPDSQIILVDGMIFSWYGSRMIHATPYFRSLWSQIR